ncbi:MAG TPA: T9SS type A sorting domain-containing protein, partial [Bacteroidetes bacterium]|nr:T9SS type A sorting domain-containing protein [Bacteroidota bacterium]
SANFDISNTDLEAVFLGGFEPVVGNSFDVLTSQWGYTGTFSSEVLPALPSGMNWEVDYTTDNTKVTLKVVSALSLDLLSFDANSNNNGIELSWETVNEINSRGFEVQKSTNGLQWNKLAWIQAKNDRSINNYFYEDQKPYSGKNYYRLKLVSSDGKIEYSKVINMAFEGKELKIYPIPAGDYIYLENSDDMKNITIFDLNGNKQITPKVSGNKIDVSSLKSGMYFIKTKDGKYFKFIIK